MSNNSLEQFDSIEKKITEEIAKTFESKRKRIFSKIFGAALGAIPWVGGLLNAVVDLKSGEGQVRKNELYESWLSEHKAKLKLLAETLQSVTQRLDEFPEEINQRMESEEYLQIVRKSFKVWDNSDTQEKRELVRRILTNSGTNKLVPDDLIRLFLDWINIYHEAHFSVIKIIYKQPGVSRLEIWQKLDGTEVQENSPEADLFKLLIRDLSTGSVIRQERQTDYYGNFIKKAPKKNSSPSKTMKSAFDDEEGYELTELGQQFVHYALNEAVPRIN